MRFCQLNYLLNFRLLSEGWVAMPVGCLGVTGPGAGDSTLYLATDTAAHQAETLEILGQTLLIQVKLNI